MRKHITAAKMIKSFFMFDIFCKDMKKSGSDSSIKIFHQNEMKTKKIKKDAFLPVKRSAGSQGLREKNTLFVAKWRKGRFFPKQPVGLDLDGQAERANFASFF